MDRLEQVVKKIYNALGLDILRSGTSYPIDILQPSSQFLAIAAQNFTDTFLTSQDRGISYKEIEQEIHKYEWFYYFRFGNIKVPINQATVSDIRNRHYYRYLHIFSAILSQTEGTLAGNSVLDIACNAGFWSIQACRSGADRVVGIDASPKNVNQANFIAKLLGLNQLSYQIINTYDISLISPGEFDITLFLGIFYHLDKPMMALEQIYAITRKFAVIDTALVDVQLPILQIRPDDAHFYHHQSHSNALALFPSASAVALILKSIGFREVWYVRNTIQALPKPYLVGKWGTFIAFK